MMKAFIAASLMVVTTLTQAQTKKWTLQECIDHALSHNLDVKQSQMNLQSAHIDYNQSKYSLLPVVNANAGQNYQFGRTIDRFTNQFVNQTIRSNNFGVSASLTVFNGLQSQNGITQQRYNEEAVEQSMQVTKNTISLNVASLFLQILFNKESITNAQNQVAATTKQLERAEKLAEAGATDQSNYLNLKAQKANEELAIVNAENTLAANLIALKNLMQIPASEPFDIEVPNIDAKIAEAKPTVADVYEASLSRMPEIKAAELRVRSAQFQQRVSQGMRSPNISLFANLNSVYSQNSKELYNQRFAGTQVIGITQNTNDPVLQPVIAYDTRVIGFGKQLENNFGQSAGVSFSWNLFNANQVNNAISKSKLAVEQSRLNYQKAQNTLYSDITKAVSDFNAAGARLNASQNSLDAQNLSLQYAEKRFDAGVTNVVDFLAVKNLHSNATSTLLQARYEYVFRALILDFYKGNPIRL